MKFIGPSEGDEGILLEFVDEEVGLFRREEQLRTFDSAASEYLEGAKADCTSSSSEEDCGIRAEPFTTIGGICMEIVCDNKRTDNCRLFEIDRKEMGHAILKIAE